MSTCFALGAATAEQVKHLAPAEAGPLAGLETLPSLRTLRPALAAIADAADPLELQAAFAQAMLAANPETSGVYYVDDHFVPYAGAKPVAKGWNNKRGRAEKGRADTHVTTHDGRAVCFVTGEPSGLSVTLPKALAELKKTVPAGARIMLGFDRGGAYPAVFAHCRENNVHWVSYRRAPLAVPGMLPVLSVITVERQDPHDRLDRRGSPAQGLRRRPADHPVRARAGRPADPDIGLRCVPGSAAGLAEVEVAGGELPEVRQPELRHRRDL